MQILCRHMMCWLKAALTSQMPVGHMYNIKHMVNAQDSYTINIKKIVRFQERMHLEKFEVEKIQNGRLSAIIHLDRPDIVEYHENRSRYLPGTPLL